MKRNASGVRFEDGLKHKSKILEKNEGAETVSVSSYEESIESEQKVLQSMVCLVYDNI